MINKIFLAVDGGGTKAEFVIFNEFGSILYAYKLDGNNPNFGGMDKTKSIMKKGIEIALSKVNDLSYVFIGNAGLMYKDNKTILQNYLHEIFPSLYIQCDTDLINLINLSSCKYSLILGTGISIAVKSDNEVKLVGGKGHLIDKGGSAYHIGRAAVECGLINNNEYQAGDSKNAMYAPKVFELYKKNDDRAKLILRKNAKCVADLINEAMNIYGKEKRIFVSGGLAEHFKDVYLPLIQDYIDIEFADCELPQILGAAIHCVNLFGEPNPTFKENFIKNYKKIK